jgi:broad specificity phosphatase PhoE
MGNNRDINHAWTSNSNRNSMSGKRHNRKNKRIRARRRRILFLVLLTSIIVASVFGIIEYRNYKNYQSSHYTVTVYLMRHGETVDNVERRVSGSDSNSPITDNGMKQLKAAGRKLQNVKFDACYSSPLGRTMKSARTVLRENKYWDDGTDKIHTVKNLKDIDMGKADEMLIMDAVNMYGERSLETGSINDPDFKSPIDAETTYHFVKRFDKAMNSIVEDKANHNGTVFVVAHSSASYWIRKITGNKKYHMITNAEVVKLQYKNGKWKVM